MNLQIKINLLVFLIGLSLTSTMIAQEVVTLNLVDAIEKTQTNNLQAKVAQYDFLAAETDIGQMKSLYLPQIEATATGSVNNLPLQSFGSLLQQGAIEQSDFSPQKLNNPTAITNLQTQLMIRQPLINKDGQAMKNALIAKKEGMAQKQVRTQKILAHQVWQTYLQLQLTYEMTEVLLQAKSTATANLKLTQDNLEVGYAQMADVLAVALSISELEHQLLETEQHIQNASDQLSFLMGEKLGTRYKPATSLLQADKSAILLAEMPNNRSDIMAVQYQIDAQKHQINALQKKNSLRLNAFGLYELNNRLDFQQAQHGYLLGLQASWLIFNGNKDKNRIQKAQIALKKQETILNQMTEQNNLELALAKRKMLEAQNKIDFAKKAIAQATEVLRIKMNRYKEGLEQTTDVLAAESKVAQMQLNYKEAIYQYQKAYAQILFSLEQ